jgi:hypothetical protein
MLKVMSSQMSKAVQHSAVQSKRPPVVVKDESKGRLFTGLLSIFLLSGPIKLTLNAFGVNTPVEFTLLSTISLLPFMIIGKRLTVRETFVLSLFSVFMFYYVIRSLTEYSGLYAQEKLLNSFLNLFALFAVIRGGRFHFRTAFWVFIVVGLSFLVLVLMSLRFGFLEMIISLLPVDNPSEVLAEFRAGYLTCALILTVSALLLRVAYPSRQLFPVSIVVGFLCFLIGARGPMIFFLLVLLFIALHNARRLSHKGIWTYLTNGSMLLIVVLLLSDLVEGIGDSGTILDPSIKRFSNLSNFTGESIDVRVDQLRFVFISAYSYLDVLIGHGVGSFGILYANMDVRMYPHNFLAELFFETGLIGLILMVCMLLLCVKGSIGRNWMFWIVLLIFLNAMKTYAFEDLRLLFAFAALTLISRPALNVEEQL